MCNHQTYSFDHKTSCVSNLCVCTNSNTQNLQPSVEFLKFLIHKFFMLLFTLCWSNDRKISLGFMLEYSTSFVRSLSFLIVKKGNTRGNTEKYVMWSTDKKLKVKFVGFSTKAATCWVQRKPFARDRSLYLIFLLLFFSTCNGLLLSAWEICSSTFKIWSIELFRIETRSNTHTHTLHAKLLEDVDRLIIFSSFFRPAKTDRMRIGWSLIRHHSRWSITANQQQSSCFSLDRSPSPARWSIIPKNLTIVNPCASYFTPRIWRNFYIWD